MIREILKYGAPELEKTCDPVEDFDQSLSDLVRDMFETMYAAPGLGLAAPQIGLNIRLTVIDVTGGKEKGHQLVLANPRIVEESGSQKEEEGCLSIPGITAVVERPEWVKVAAQNLAGQACELEGTGLLARALCHEIDHLEGILYLERISAIKRDFIKRKIRKMVKAGEW